MGQSLRLALSGQSDRTHVCPLLDQSGHSLILALGGLSANDPKRTFSLLATYEVQQKVSDVWCQLSRDVQFLLDQRCPEMQG